MMPKPSRSRRVLGGYLVALATLLPASPAFAQPLAQSTISHDGSLGSGPIPETATGTGLFFEIGEANGYRPGGDTGVNLLHSFERFELAGPDTARFTADFELTTENLVVRVTDAPTLIEGRLESSISGAHLYWLSPEGIFFGENSKLLVLGSFSASTADSLSFTGDGQSEIFEARAGGAVPTLAMARPEAFGFLGDAHQRIVFDGSLICGVGYQAACGGVEIRGDLSLQAGGVNLLGGTNFLINGKDVEIVATDSIEISANGADPERQRSGIFVTNGSVAEGGSITLSADRIHLTDATTLMVNNHGGNQTTSGGEISLTATSAIRMDGTDATNQPLGPLTVNPGEDFGSTHVFAIRDTLQKGSVDILTVGSQADAAGGAGAITLEAPVIEILDGAEITTYALGTESADINLIAPGRLELSGRGGDAAGSGSAVQSRNQGAGEAGARAGDVIVQAGEVLLRDGASLAVDTGGRGDAGQIEIDARLLVIDGASGLRSSSTATSADLQVLGAGSTPGQAGRIAVNADAVLLAGASEISVFAAEGPPVPAGLTAGEASPPGVNEGNIFIAARDLLLLKEGSRIEASVESGLGGSIEIGHAEAPTTAVVLQTGGKILAQAAGGTGTEYVPPGEGDTDEPPAPPTDARGGDIAIYAQAVLACPDCPINADGPTTGTEGSVVINNPETNLDSQARPPALAFLDASSLLLAQCGAEQSGAEDAGRLAVARWPGRAFAPEGPLLAMAPLGGGRTARVRPTASAAPGVRADTAAAGDARAPDDTFALALNAARETLRGGGSGRARADFEALERRAGEHDDPADRGDALRGLGESRQAAGAYADSLAPLDEALALARASGDAAREAAALGALGNARVAQGQFPEAEQALTRAVALARGAKTAIPRAEVARRGPASSLVAALLNNLGGERALAGDPQGALDAYLESAAEARQTSDTLGLAQAEANTARAALRLGQGSDAREAARRARTSLVKARDEGRATHAEAAALGIHLAHSELELAQREPAERRGALLRAHADLMEASRSAEAGGDARAASYALGSLGGLYAEEGGRDAEALYLTRRALAQAEGAQAADLLARWNAQAGGLDWRAGRTDAALDAYRRAVQLLAETRPEAGAARGQADVAFRQAVEPVYLDLVDLLLRSSSAQEGSASQALLVEARQVVEDWKAAELRNYFRDGCAAELEASAKSIESIDPRAVVVYPILLPERLEILVGRSSGIERYTVPVPRATIEAEAGRFRDLLTKQTTHEYRRPAQQLYRWLVAPFAASLDPAGVDTLVFVPGGALRTVPLAALHDGEGFLLERYAVAITPSMNLLAPKPIAPSERNSLLAGLSEAVQGYPALPGVPAELASIERLYGGQVLLDSDFESETLANSLRESRPGLVHIASHAEFTGEPETSFVLTHSGSLSIEDLSRLIRAGRYGREPVELLMLSACETAAGNERAALGLAGVAIRAGARSAMGSLWSVSDQATSALVVEFYEALDRPGMTKARALQAAQTTLLADARYRHPYYWAPFLVINNWL